MHTYIINYIINKINYIRYLKLIFKYQKKITTYNLCVIIIIVNFFKNYLKLKFHSKAYDLQWTCM